MNVLNHPVITFEGSGCDEREIIMFVKSQPPSDVHRQYLDVSLIDLQARVSRFRCRIFHCFVHFSLKSYRLMIFLHLELFQHR